LRPRPPDAFGSRKPDELSGDEKNEDHDRGGAQARDGKPARGDDREHNPALDPVGDEKADDLAHGRA